MPIKPIGLYNQKAPELNANKTSGAFLSNEGWHLPQYQPIKEVYKILLSNATIIVEKRGIIGYTIFSNESRTFHFGE